MAKSTKPKEIADVGEICDVYAKTPTSKSEDMASAVVNNNCVNDFVGSLLPKSGTMGSKWGQARRPAALTA